MRSFEDYKVLEGKTVEVGARMDAAAAKRVLRARGEALPGRGAAAQVPGAAV